MNKDLLASSFASALRNSLHRSETESAQLGTLLCIVSIGLTFIPAIFEELAGWLQIEDSGSA